MKYIRVIVTGSLFFLSLSLSYANEKVISQGSKVKMNYVLTVEGNLIENTKEKGPLEFVQGEGRLFLGLENQMYGLKEGEKKTIKVAPEGAYGAVNPEAFDEVEKSRLPKDLELKKGLRIRGQGPGGENFPVIIAEVREKTVIIDFNHPLAGKELIFDIEVVSIE
jgi:FKBP-type peptidyl-prolyl cis-trans isomerase 2